MFSEIGPEREHADDVMLWEYHEISMALAAEAEDRGELYAFSAGASADLQVNGEDVLSDGGLDFLQLDAEPASARLDDLRTRLT